MSTVNADYPKIYLNNPQSSTSLRTDKLQKYNLEVKFFNKDGNKYLDAKEVQNIREEVAKCTVNGFLDFNKLNDLAKKIGTTFSRLREFLYSIDGMNIADGIYSTLKSCIDRNSVSSISMHDLKTKAEKINKKNVSKMLSSYYSKRNSTVIDDIFLILNVKSDDTKSIIKHIVYEACKCCEDRGINIDADLMKFKQALNNNDAENIRLYANKLCNQAM